MEPNRLPEYGAGELRQNRVGVLRHRTAHRDELNSTGAVVGEGGEGGGIVGSI